jgi:hypothetical protein
VHKQSSARPSLARVSMSDDLKPQLDVFLVALEASRTLDSRSVGGAISNDSPKAQHSSEARSARPAAVIPHDEPLMQDAVEEDLSASWGTSRNTGFSQDDLRGSIDLVARGSMDLVVGSPTQSSSVVIKPGSLSAALTPYKDHL